VTVRFYGGLNDFLRHAQRHVRFAHDLRRRASVKDVIEALGVPHAEVDVILVNGEPSAFSRLLQPDDDVAAYPRFRAIDVDAAMRAGEDPPRPIRFALDQHLRKLAALLRLAGFDALLVAEDAELAEAGAREQRVVLTRDVALLKRSLVRHGYWVRHVDPEEQLTEVLRRFELAAAMTPFARCSRCNAPLVAADAQAVAARVAACTRAEFTEFHECPGCARVYWKGSHYARLRHMLERASARAACASRHENC
jgi:uncharacterized protein with PIN domain